jgi:hypothetical protein
MSAEIQRFPEGRPLEASRWCTYKELMIAVQAAKRIGYNRQLPAHVVRRLDSQGIATFKFVMLHEQIDGEDVEHPHVRAYAFIKVRGKTPKGVRPQDVAHQQHLDIPLASWRRWRTGDER